MNIIVVADVSFPEGMASTAHVLLMVKGMRGNGVSSALMIPAGEYTGAANELKSKKGRCRGVPFLFINQKRASINNLFALLLQIISPAIFLLKRKIRKRNDVIIAYDHGFIKYSAIYTVCRLFGIPLFPWHVEKRSSEEFTGIKGFCRHMDFWLSERLLPKFAKGIIVISNPLKIYHSKFISEDKIFISPILVDTDEWHRHSIPEQFYRLNSFFGNHHPVIGYSGSFARKDGFTYILKAFQKFVALNPRAALVAAGKADKSVSMQNILQLVDNMGLKDNFFYLGLLSRREMKYVNHAADLLLVCRTKSEFAKHGFPWKLGEYLMTKNPVVGTRVGDIETYLSDGEEIYLAEPENAQSICDKICEVFAQYENARITAENGYKKALKVFDYRDRTKAVIHFIKYILEQAVMAAKAQKVELKEAERAGKRSKNCRI